MVISMLVVLGAVAVVLLLVPRTNSVVQPPVDVARGAVAAAEQVDFTPSVPTGLPSDWRATSVRTTRSTAGVLTWHAGYQTSSDQYAAVEQGQDAPAEWVRAQTNRAPTAGTVDLVGRTWTRYVRTDKVQNSLVSTSGGVTTVVTGTAGFDELGQARPEPAPAALTPGPS
ncbi:hypothetical protein GCM10025868_13520 [Angustibacter aerolatus]|uniref:DUF4245 domain-containing protein n=1 Tax=Angustibacter aerolatus TaxID=1162965 RepID=A0ABQ6JGR6_9ACTN|nr:hypothetical protein GCM10025868_13520 [Angustibacter aerolatus]